MGLQRVQAGPYRIQGVSIGGIGTSLHVRELDVLLDVGVPFRASAAANRLFLSHAHADHIGALISWLGIRGLASLPLPTIYAPAPIVDTVHAMLELATTLQRHDCRAPVVAVEAGQELPLQGDLHVRAFRTHHPVPSLGYQFFRRVRKLRPEFAALAGTEIKRRREAGEELFYEDERLELAFATDTLLRVIDTEPAILRSKVLVLECTFLDDRKSLEASRAGCHIHLDELVIRADAFENEQLVLMHFSQLYEPADVHRILEARLPRRLWERTVVFAPGSGTWFGG